VLGSGGVRADVLTAGGLPIGRFSRWCRRLIAAPPPGADPFGYLSLVSRLCSAGEYEAVLATHEQAWVFAAGRHLLPADAPVAVAPIEAFDRVAGKVEFAARCDELGIPQPRWWRCDQRPAQVPYPHWVKASYGTAGRAVRRVDTAEQERQAVQSSAAPAPGPAAPWRSPSGRPSATEAARPCSACCATVPCGGARPAGPRRSSPPSSMTRPAPCPWPPQPPCWSPARAARPRSPTAPSGPTASAPPPSHWSGRLRQGRQRAPKRNRRCYDRVLRYRVSETAKNVRRIPADQARDPHA